MSSLSRPPNVFLRKPNYNEKHLALVTKILQKTSEGKIRWQKTGFGYLASLSNMRFAFQLLGNAWDSFSVIVDSKRVLNVKNSLVPSFITQLVGPVGDPIVERTAELYNLISREEVADVESAIDALDKL
jgi:hypothetical protein